MSHFFTCLLQFVKLFQFLFICFLSFIILFFKTASP
jgi:hypothetical protein